MIANLGMPKTISVSFWSRSPIRVTLMFTVVMSIAFFIANCLKLEQITVVTKHVARLKLACTSSRIEIAIHLLCSGGPGLRTVRLGEVAIAAGWVRARGLEGAAFRWVAFGRQYAPHTF